MSFTENTVNKPDAATLALWRAAEAGELGEVEAMLPRVADLNARNEHGVTALMRAAQHGHAKVVRLLLANGADANIIRNDKFSALSLAAFFGHTGVVRVLMDHGADSKASTRNGTSPHMWATARTFNEVVDQLKKPAPPRSEERTIAPPTTCAPVAPVAAAAPVKAPVSSAIVRTLREPPEIWDLVHEEPK
ncbi:MAG TPA: ankyrin repeat domain-containing protein, partial [Pyrinomonadaceae bacterium]|nr:ankyrin repeat domain-containing protein [Pyrinomonadaceae bacterium]